MHDSLHTELDVRYACENLSCVRDFGFKFLFQSWTSLCGFLCQSFHVLLCRELKYSDMVDSSFSLYL